MTEGTIALVDLSHLIMIRWGVDPHTCVSQVGKWLRSIDEGYGGRMLVALDSPPYSRNEIFEAYKANRKEKEPELVQAIDEIRQAAYARFPGRVFAVPGAEADDVIATLVSAFPQGTPVHVHTSDKDLFHLVAEGIEVISPRTGVVIQKPSQVKELLGVFPEQVQDFIALAGDSADGIPGAKSIGAKKAAALLEQFGNLTNVLKAADASDPKLDPKLRVVITENRALIATCYLLAQQVIDLPIEFSMSVFDQSRERETAHALPPGPEPMSPSVENEPEARARRKEHGLNIFQRMREVMKDVPGIKKGTQHAQGYAYTGHEAMTWNLRPAYIRHGIVRTISVESVVYVGEPHRDTLSMTCIVRWTNVDDPTDFHEVKSVGVAPPTVTKDYTDKNGVVTPGKRTMMPTQSGVAMSYAQKNAEFKAFCITGDDTPDAEEYS